MDTNSYKTASVRHKDIKKEWILVDARNEVLGRVASQVAKMIRGKHKPYYTPHIDCGDQVIVINAAYIRLTGKKWSDKEYVHYTGYPGGKRVNRPKDLLKKDPTKIVEKAVQGMLPKNRLGNKLKNNLFVYAEETHPHEAQKPRKINIKDIK